jgi:ABC-type multidrug transport system fused ATPase/permease subunit
MKAETKHHIIMPAADNAPVHTANILAWIWYFSAPYKAIILPFFAFRILRSTILSSLPLFIGVLINSFENGAAHANPDLYLTALLGFMFFYALSMINIIFIPEIRAYEKASRALTLHAINHVNSLSLDWHEAQGSGGKLQRIMTGRKAYQELCRHFRWDLLPFLGNLFSIVVTFIIMDIPLIYIPYYALFVITYIAASMYFARPFFNLYNAFNDKFENLISGVYEFVTAIRTVKAFNLNHSILDKARHLEEEGQEAIIKTFSSNLLRWTICNLIAAFWLSLFAWFGFNKVLDGGMTPGTFTATFFMAYNIWLSAEVIANVWEKIYEHGNGLYRLTTTLCVQPKNLDIEPIISEFPKDWDAITFNNCTFSYGETADGQGVKNLDFVINRGEKIALVGPSGAGKSTLVKLLMKQTLPQDGAIELGTHNLNHIRSAHWLKQIGFVPQDVELFNMSIRDNIILNAHNIDEATYRGILDKAVLTEFIDSLPESDETMVGERGIKLSGGQRQRLGIARALARTPQLIILDEATSSLDSLSESKIQKAIENAFTDHTMVIIAHRLSTIRHVNRIIVMDEGRVVESGRFDELLNANGLFAKLWEIQSEKI